jgi:hypothetical protein
MRTQIASERYAAVIRDVAQADSLPFHIHRANKIKGLG